MSKLLEFIKGYLVSNKIAWFAIGLFVLFYFWFAVNEAKAEMLFEIGPSQVSTELSTGVIVTMSERFKNKYDITAGYISEQHLNFENVDRAKWVLRPQLLLCAERSFTSFWSDNFRLGMGPCWFQNDDRVAPTKFRWGLKAEWRLSKHWGLAMRHWSTAGTGPIKCYPLDYRQPNAPGARCNDWNTGQDSWLRIVYYTK